MIETLRNYKPKSSPRHKSNSSHPMFATLTGLNPFSDKEHHSVLSNRLRSESSALSEGDEADMEDGVKLKKKKGKGKLKQRQATTIVASEDFESAATTPEQYASAATTPATHSPVDKHTTHKYPPTPSGPRSVDPHTEDPTIVVQAAKAFKTAVLHDARNIKGATDELEALIFSVSSTHEAKVGELFCVYAKPNLDVSVLPGRYTGLLKTADIPISCPKISTPHSLRRMKLKTLSGFLTRTAMVTYRGLRSSRRCFACTRNVDSCGGVCMMLALRSRLSIKFCYSSLSSSCSSSR